MSFSSSKPKLPPPAPMPADDLDFEAARRSEMRRLRSLRGRRSTILTWGVEPSGTVQQKSLLGM